MQQQLQRAAVSGMRSPGLSLFAQRGITTGIRGPTVAQHAAASLAGRIRAPAQVFFHAFRKLAEVMVNLIYFCHKDIIVLIKSSFLGRM